MYLPGLGYAAATAFAHVVSHPALGRHRSLLVDWLGFGLSDRPPAFPYTLDAHAETIVQLIEHLGLDAAELIGHSFGGAVAIMVAARRPDRVQALVVAEPNLDPGGGALSRSIAAQTEDAYVSHGHRAEPEQLSQAARFTEQPARWWTCQHPPRASNWPPYASHARAWSVQRTLQTAVASGDPRDWSHVQDLLAVGLRVRVVPDAGHVMVWDNPDGLAHVLADSLTTDEA